IRRSVSWVWRRGQCTVVTPERSSRCSRVPVGKEAGEVAGQWGVKDEPVTGNWMGKLEMRGMEKLARRQGRVETAVEGIANDRVVDRGQVDAYLMRPAGLELELKQRAAPSALQHAKPRAGLASACFQAYQRHPLAMAWIAPQRCLDGALGHGH